VSWFNILIGMRYRGTCSDAVVDAAVRRGLITPDEGVLIKAIPNGGFPATVAKESAASEVIDETKDAA